MKIAGYVEERSVSCQGTWIHFTGSTGIYQYHNENIAVLEIKCDLFPIRRFRQKQSKIGCKSMKLSP